MLGFWLYSPISKHRVSENCNFEIEGGTCWILVARWGLYCKTHAQCTILLFGGSLETIQLKQIYCVVFWKSVALIFNLQLLSLPSLFPIRWWSHHYNEIPIPALARTLSAYAEDINRAQGISGPMKTHPNYTWLRLRTTHKQCYHDNIFKAKISVLRLIGQRPVCVKLH